MKIKNLAAAIGAVCFMGAAGNAASADSGFYLEGKLGASFLNADDMRNTTNVANPATVNVRNESDTVLGVGAAVGYNWKPKFNAPLRTDLEYMYRTALNYAPNPTFTNAGIPTRSDGDLNSHSVMANLYWDMTTWNGLTPFLSGGLGVALNRTDSDGTVIATGVKKNYTQDNLNFAWTLGGGVNYAIAPKWSLGLAYRYIDLGEASFGDSNPADAEITSDDVHTHEVLLGLRYQF